MEFSISDHCVTVGIALSACALFARFSSVAKPDALLRQAFLRSYYTSQSHNGLISFLQVALLIWMRLCFHEMKEKFLGENFRNYFTPLWAVLSIRSVPSQQVSGGIFACVQIIGHHSITFCCILLLRHSDRIPTIITMGSSLFCRTIHIFMHLLSLLICTWFLKNQVRQTGFLACKNQFRNWLLQATQAVKIQFEID